MLREYLSNVHFPSTFRERPELPGLSGALRVHVHVCVRERVGGRQGGQPHARLQWIIVSVVIC